MSKTSILTIMIQVAKTGNADREVIKGLAQLKTNVTQAIGVLGALAGVGYALNSTYQNTVKVFMDYATQVRDLSRVSGMAAEDSSRLIQAADDVTLSYEALQKAAFFASKNGFEVNIESLAQLADQYVALNSPTAQAELLVKKFGKGGAEMGKLLKEGGQGVRELTGAIADNLVLTSAQVAEAEEARLAMDAWNDSVLGLKVAAGSAFLPIVQGTAEALSATMAYGEAMSMVEQELGRTDQRSKLYGATLILQAQAHEQSQNAADSATTSYMAMAEAIGSNTVAMEENADAAATASQGYQDMMGLIMNLQGASDSYREKQAELTSELVALNFEQNKYREGTAAFDEVQGKIDATKGSINELAAEYEASTKRIAFSLLQQKAAMDGLTDAEFNGLLVIGEQWGILDTSTVNAAQTMNAQMEVLAKGLDKPINKMTGMNEKANSLWNLSQREYNFDVNINVSGSFPKIPSGGGSAGLTTSSSVVGGGGQVEMMAGGGQLGNGWTMVGEQGFELVSPTGRVFSHEDSLALLKGGVLPEFEFAWGGSLPGSSSGTGPTSNPNSSGISPASIPANAEAIRVSQTAGASQTAQGAEALAAMQSTNQQLTSLMQEMVDNQRNSNATLTRAIKSAMQQANI